MKRRHATILYLLFPFVAASTCRAGEPVVVPAAEFQALLSAYALVKTRYVEAPDDKKLLEGAIAGMLASVAITAGIYSLVGFEVTPSAVIGFLTVLSYSLYDSVVVFDKVRENTEGLLDGTAPPERAGRKYSDQVNLAVNQTLVRSINTSVVGILPVGSILFIGWLVLGAGTLKDLSLSLFVGIIVGTAATLFVAAPLYALLRRGEPAIQEQEARAGASAERAAEEALAH